MVTVDNNIKYNQPTPTPTPKVQAAGVGGAVTSILIWGLKAFFNVELPAEVGAALATIVAFVSAYLTRDRKPIEAVDIIQQSAE